MGNSSFSSPCHFTTSPVDLNQYLFFPFYTHCYSIVLKRLYKVSACFCLYARRHLQIKKASQTHVPTPAQYCILSSGMKLDLQLNNSPLQITWSSSRKGKKTKQMLSDSCIQCRGMLSRSALECKTPKQNNISIGALMEVKGKQNHLWQLRTINDAETVWT